jgi:hypothetical protein
LERDFDSKRSKPTLRETPQKGKSSAEKRSNNSSEASEFTTVRLVDYLELKNLVKLTLAELSARIPSAKKKPASN